MTSKEMEARSGVPRANIRYYEAEGLLHPARAKNGYREYSEADLAVLEKIKLLRRLGVSVEELRALGSGGETLTAVLDRRLAAQCGRRGSALGSWTPGGTCGTWMPRRCRRAGRAGGEMRRLLPCRRGTPCPRCAASPGGLRPGCWISFCCPW